MPATSSAALATSTRARISDDSQTLPPVQPPRSRPSLRVAADSASMASEPFLASFSVLTAMVSPLGSVSDAPAAVTSIASPTRFLERG